MADIRRVTDSFATSPQLLPGDMAEAAAQGFTLVINNRPDGEAPGQPAGADVEAAARAAGMDYLHVPVTGGPTPEQVARVRQAVEAAPGPVLAFCRSGTRSIVTWARGPMADLFDGCLDDPRVSISQGDIGELIAAKKEAFDAILLDVDNGPEGLTRRENDRLYDTKGLARTYAALRPGGVLAVWSSGPDSSFTTRLQRTGFAVEEVKVRARQKKRGARHVIWLATRP